MKPTVKSALQLEKRKYFEDASAEEITAIKNSVSLLDEQTIFFLEVPVITPFSANLAFDQIDLYASKLGNCGLIIDLSLCKKPDSIARRTINDRFKKLPENILHVAFFTKQNIIVKTAIKFVMFQSILDSYSVSSTMEEATLALNKILND